MSDRLIRKISELDTMCDQGEEVYFNVGRSALAVCKRYIAEQPKIVVDFPSGYGRALRWFMAEWPLAEFHAVETDSRALDFISQVFGAEVIQSDAAMNIKLPSSCDLIFTGSLLTHFDNYQWDNYLKLCIESLSPTGTLVFTTHGRTSATQLRGNPFVFGDLIDGKSLLQMYLDTGFAYQPYSKDYPEFGVSLSSPEWIFRKLQKIANIRIVAFEERGWGQDVVAVRLNGWPYATQ